MRVPRVRSISSRNDGAGLTFVLPSLLLQDERAQPHLFPYLNLTSISSFTLEMLDYENAYESTLSLDRITSSIGQISVNQLTRPPPPLSIAPTLSTAKSKPSLSILFLPRFNPQHVELVGRPPRTPAHTFHPLVDLGPTSRALPLVLRRRVFEN